MGIIINGQNDTIGPVDNTMSLLGTVSIGGTMTIEDFTNIDSVGLITARNGIDVTSGTVTITTGANSASPAGSGDNLVIKDSNGCGLSILSGNGNSQNIYLGSVSDNDAVRLEGFYNSGSPYFNIYTNGSERLRISSSGQLLLGTTDAGPSTADDLTIATTGNTGISIRSGTSSSGNIFFSDGTSGGDQTRGVIQYDHSSNYMRLYTDNAERLRITSGGNIGIKNTSPNNTLTVGDTVQPSYAPSSAGNYIEIARTSGADAGLLINKNTGQWLVGIDNSDGANAPLRFEYGAAGSAHPGLGSANPAMMIKHDGRMGLGTNNPYHELHIQGSGDTRALITSGGTGDAAMMFENASGNTWGHGIDLTNNNYVIAYNNTSDPSLTADGKVEITTAGRLGVGLASPNSNLHILGGSDSTDNLLLTLQSNGVASDGSLSTGLRLINSTSTTSIHGADIRAIRTGSTAADLAFSLYDGNSPQTERLRITSSGMVGINMTPSTVGNSTYMLQMYNSGSQCFMSIGNGTSGNGPLNGLVLGVSNAAHYIQGRENLPMIFATNDTERLRINATGPVAGNPSSGDGDNFAGTALKNDANAWIDIFKGGWISTGGGWGTFWAGSSGAAYRRVPGDTNPNEFVFVGAGQKRFTFDLDSGGNAYFDGSLAQNNYDYAEYFEWEDGNPNNEDRRGYSVFLNANGKIEKATSETSTSDIIGVISGTAAIIGDAAVYDWQGRYEIDEWGTRRKEQVTQVSWTDADGTKHSYADENDVPSDVVVPDDASRRIHYRYIESSTYDSSQAYVPRDQRREWGIVGLLGKVRVRNDSPKHPNWKYIKTIAGKDLWLIK